LFYFIILIISAQFLFYINSKSFNMDIVVFTCKFCIIIGERSCVWYFEFFSSLITVQGHITKYLAYYLVRNTILYCPSSFIHYSKSAGLSIYVNGCDIELRKYSFIYYFRPGESFHGGHPQPPVNRADKVKMDIEV